MSTLPSEVIKEIVGSIAVGPAGFGIHAEVAPGATPSADLTSVEMRVDDRSVAAAHARNDGGPNREFAALDMPTPKGAERGLAVAAATQGSADDRYHSLSAKRSLNGVMMGANGMPYQPRRLHNQRAIMARQNLKNPLLRMRRRNQLALRRTIDESKQRNIHGLNPYMMPDSVRERVIEEALQNGEQNTAFGPTADLAPQLVAKKAMAAPEAAPMKKGSVRAAYNRGFILMDGSYMDGPTLKSKA